jgi:hypothetical protein
VRLTALRSLGFFLRGKEDRHPQPLQITRAMTLGCLTS